EVPTISRELTRRRLREDAGTLWSVAELQAHLQARVPPMSACPHIRMSACGGAGVRTGALADTDRHGQRARLTPDPALAIPIARLDAGGTTKASGEEQCPHVRTRTS